MHVERSVYLGPYFKARYYKKDFLYTKRICVTQHCPQVGMEQEYNKYCPECGMKIDEVEFLINKSSINPVAVTEQLHNKLVYVEIDSPTHHIYIPNEQEKYSNRDLLFCPEKCPPFEMLLSNTNYFVNEEISWLNMKFSEELDILERIYEAYPVEDHGFQVYTEWGLLNIAKVLE